MRNAAFCLLRNHFVLRCALHPNPISPNLQFLRIQLEGIEFRVGFTQRFSEQRLISLLFLFEFMDPADPSLHDGRALAAAVNQIGGPLLVLLRFLAHKDIELRRHLVALLVVVRHKEAVHHQRLVVLVCPVQLIKEVLEQVYLVHLIPRDKIQLAVNRNRQGVQRLQIVQQDRVDLASSQTLAENQELLLHAPAQLLHVKRRIVLHNIVVHPVRIAVIADIRQLVIAVGPQANGLAHQLTGIEVSIPLIVAAVDAEDLLRAAGAGYRPARYLAGRVPERVHRRDTPSRIGEIQRIADAFEILLFHQHIRQ